MFRFTSSTPTQVACIGDSCGGKCGGELVAVLTSAKAKTVRVAPCSVLIGQGWTLGHQTAVGKEDLAGLARYGL